MAYINPMNMVSDSFTCRLCGHRNGHLKATITSRPQGETDYLIAPEEYRRRIVQCEKCKVFNNCHAFIPENFYSGSYNQLSYGEKMLARYAKVRALSYEESDNKQRARRLHDYLAKQGNDPASTSVLDVGIGLGVFLAEMKDYGYRCSGVDPDPRAIKHAEEIVGIESAMVGMVESVTCQPVYSLITLNKVLEHVADPVKALNHVTSFLLPDSSVYVELPDGDAASDAAGFVDRQEFFVEHLTIWNKQSMLFLAASCGLFPVELQSIHEPSGKYTIYAILRKNA